jgi:hypothetical protein
MRVAFLNLSPRSSGALNKSPVTPVCVDAAGATRCCCADWDWRRLQIRVACSGVSLVGMRERYWITAQPGEVRACDGCHGVNQINQVGQPASMQTAQAFIDLLIRWRTQAVLFVSGFE